jgi:hypothetical protein
MGLLMCRAVSDERTGLLFTIVTGPRQRSHFWVRVPRDSRPYCDSTPETLVTNYEQRIAAQRFKAIPTVTKNPLLHPTQQRRC